MLMPPKTSELVSTIIPTFNHEEFLPFAIRSALKQTHRPHEIIVVDDGSTDSTEALVKRFSNLRLRYIYQDHQGLSAARNAGIAASRGQYLTFLDADDLLFPAAVEVLLAAAKRRGAAFVAGSAIVTDRTGQSPPRVMCAKPSFKPADLLQRNPFHVGSVLVSRRWVELAGGFCTGLHACEDWDLWLRLARSGCPMDSVQSAVSLYLNHEGQMSRNPYLMRDASLEVLERIFSDRATSRSWRAARADAYANAHLRCAARFLRAQSDYEAQEEIRAAVRIRPLLLSQKGKRIIQELSSWLSDPMIKRASDYKSSMVKAASAVVKESRGGASRRRGLSVGVVVGDETWHFFKEIYDYLCRRYQVSVFRPIAGVGPRNTSLIHDLRDFLKQHRVAFFEWSSQLLALATQLETDCRIVTRLHRYELFTWADRVDWSRVDATILVSSAMLKKFRAASQASPARTVVIPPGVSTTRFHQPGRRRLTHRIGTLCWLSPRKRVYELILSFAGLCRSDPQLKLSIAGGPHPSFPDYYDTLVSLIQKLKLSRRVELVGEPRDVVRWYRTVDVFVSNSYSEGLQVALLEAMASGCYCLSHAWPGVEDVLPNNQIFSTDRELHEHLLAYYAAPPAFRSQAQDKMRRRAARVFDVELVQRRIGSLIAEVAR